MTRGSVFALLGSNGAGKTTTVRILSTLTDADAGPDGAGAFSYPLIFLPFISSAFVPTENMPGPVRWFAEHQPVTPIVNAIRDLLAQQPVGADLWLALAWCAAILVAAASAAMAIHRRRVG